jgi:hypothetical protein
VKIDVEFYEKVFLGLTGVALLVMLGALFVTRRPSCGRPPSTVPGSRARPPAATAP